MKKNTMMRIASFLLIAVLLSTSAISGTYAKYVTSDNASDTARVAKFGVVATAGGSLFSTTYLRASNNNPGTGDITVNSFDTEVVAPGTRNDTGMSFHLSGTPEVNVYVDFKFEATSEIMLAKGTYADNPTTGKANDEFKVNDDYYPVVFVLKNNGTELISGNVTDINDWLNDPTNGLTGEYPAQTDLSNIAGNGSGDYTLTWYWDYGAFNADAGNDAADTYLGNAAAKTYFSEGTFPTDGATLGMDVTFTITVTQVD